MEAVVRDLFVLVQVDTGEVGAALRAVLEADVDTGEVGASLCEVLEAGVRDVVSLAQVGASLREVLQADIQMTSLVSPM